MDPKQRFRDMWVGFLSDYKSAKRVGGDRLINFARSFRTENIVSDLYALRNMLKNDPALEAEDKELLNQFKEIADRGLAWETGFPDTAVREYSRHKELASWDINGSEMVLSLLSDDPSPQKCSANLKAKIKDDFKKMTGYDFKEEFWGGGDPPTYIKIPAPESRTLRARLIGNTIAAHGLSDTPIPPSLIKKVMTDPLFKALDDYQKKMLKAADSPEAMGAAFCELTMLLPFNYLNELMSGLSSYLKDWANMPIKGGSRRTPRTPGAPEPTPDAPSTPSRTPDPSTPDPNRTMGDLAAGQWLAVLSERYNNELLHELSMMKDAKSQALYTLMDEWKTVSSDPAIEKNTVKYAQLMEKRKQVFAQFEEMKPFIVKHARDRGNFHIDATMLAAPHGEEIQKSMDQQVERINRRLTPDGLPIVGQTAPDFMQLFDQLEGNTFLLKRKNFNQSYRALNSEIQNNALVYAIKNIMDTTDLSTEERQRRFQELMEGETVWTPGDLKAANKLIEALHNDRHIKAVPTQTQIKPYGQKATGQEQDVVSVARTQMTDIEKDLKTIDDKGLKGNMHVHHDLHNNVDVAEMVDLVSGSITLRVGETGQKPWFITYCEAQQKIVIMDRNKRLSLLDYKDASEDMQVTCRQLAGHFTQIKNKRSPFNDGDNLTNVFTKLVAAGRVKDTHEMGMP